LNTFNKILAALGFLLLIATCVLSMTYMGFTTHPKTAVKVVLIPNIQILWLVNIGFGLIGGVLINYKRIIASAVSGLITSVVITGSTLLYISFRTTILNYEMLVPLSIGAIAGGMTYNFIISKFYNDSEGKIKTPIM
jgi:hypothetical protein